MITPANPIHEELLASLRESDGRCTLAEFLRTRTAPPEHVLAELIETDGRFRISRGDSVELDDYLQAIPDLRRIPVALDAAIDMTLRSLTSGSTPTEDAVHTLVANYPDLEPAILDAAVLGRTIWTTEQIAPARAADTLPADYGMMIGGGRRQYRLLERLGDGASGDVFLAEDRLLSDADKPALVAVKILRLDGADPWARRQAVDEAAKARRIDHPNVVRVLNRGVTEGAEEFVVYEYVKGGDLGSPRFVEKVPMAQREAGRLVSAIARGVQAAHSAGLVHCDIKPGNVLLAADGTPKVADFGAAIRPRDAEHASVQSRPVGTLAFMSPEQFRMEPGALAPPADVYALGGILHWLLTGRLANGSTRDEVVAAHLADPPTPAPSPRAVRAEIDEDLDAICRRALAPRGKDRYSSPGALADDLDAWLRREPIRWTRPSVARLASLWVHRRPAVAGALGAALLIAIGGGAATLTMWRRAEERRHAAELAEIRAIQREHDRELDGRFVQNLAPTWLDEDGWQRRTAYDLMMYWWLESMVGRHRDADARIPEELGDMRVEYIRARLDQVVASSGDDTLAAILLRFQLAFWLVQQRDADEALAEIEIIEPLLARRFSEGDPALSAAATLRACAVADRLLATDTSASAIDEARRLAASLLALRDAVERSIDAPALRRLIDERLMVIFDQRWLADPAQRDAAALRFEESAFATDAPARAP